MKTTPRGLLQVAINQPVPEASKAIVASVVVLDQSPKCLEGFGVLELEEFQAT
jgi:hypothetical protein